MVYRFHQVFRLNISDPFKVYSHSHICLCIQNTYFHKLKQCRLGLSKQESYSHHKHTHTCIRTVIPAWPKRIKNFRLHFVCLLEFQNKLVPRTNFAFCLFFTKKRKISDYINSQNFIILKGNIVIVCKISSKNWDLRLCICY